MILANRPPCILSQVIRNILILHDERECFLQVFGVGICPVPDIDVLHMLTEVPYMADATRNDGDTG